jgi:tripartite-type tricarboxylate transporter receptor subunit TctC
MPGGDGEECMRQARVLLALLSGMLLVPFAALAQDYPTRAVTIINPFAPGGGTDLLARMVASKLEQRLGKSFLIENKTGAGSIIAAVAVQKAAPDGYTLLMAPTPTMAVNVALYKTLPYDPLVDFIPLALLAQTPFILIVNAALPVKSVPELIAYAKANAGKMSFASVGPGVPHHLYMEMFKSMTGIEASHVPYRGSLPALNDVIAGHVPMMFVDIGPATGALQAGTVRPLGVSSRFRVPGFTDIPPIAEVGLPQFDAVGWQMLVAPASTPRPVVELLNRELTTILGQPDTKEQVLKYGFISVDNKPVAALQDYVKSETIRWGKVVKDAGIAGSQ